MVDTLIVSLGLVNLEPLKLDWGIRTHSVAVSPERIKGKVKKRRH